VKIVKFFFKKGKKQKRLEMVQEIAFETHIALDFSKNEVKKVAILNTAHIQRLRELFVCFVVFFGEALQRRAPNQHSISTFLHVFENQNNRT